MRVAIVQDNIVAGGRIVVIIAMIEVMNKLNIIPDIITFNFNLSAKEIEQKYGKIIQFKLKKIPINIFKKFPEFNKQWINFITRFYCKKYDLFIDSNNTTCLMSAKATKILSYTYFPRIKRVLDKESIKTFSDKSFKTKLALRIDNFFAKIIYKNDYIKSNTKIITLSQFAKDKIIEIYKINPEDIEIIYPPVNISYFNSNKSKRRSIATIGRFSPEKKQLEQIKIAEKFPNLEFNIMGFARKNDPYFLTCDNYIKQHNIKNVILHRSIDYKIMVNILESSKYFLHTLENEPFGITTVQGIAAGCLPIVPNSGGQIEIVPYSQLRFNNIEEVVDILTILEEGDFSNELKVLKKHINKFSENKFRNSFKKIFIELYEEITV